MASAFEEVSIGGVLHFMADVSSVRHATYTSSLRPHTLVA
jgi:hypothetical protein